MNSSICCSSTGSVTPPFASTASWKAPDVEPFTERGLGAGSQLEDLQLADLVGGAPARATAM